MTRINASGGVLLAALIAGCGGGTAEVTVALSVASDVAFDPFRANDRLAKVRVAIDGPERHDDAFRDIGLDERAAVFAGFPSERAVDVTVSGFDRQGNLVAFGRAEGVQVDGDLSIDVPFRRSLAYVTHAPICGGGCGPDSACVDSGSGYSCHQRSTGCAACDGNQACVSLRTGPACYESYAGTSAGPGRLYVLDLVSRGLVTEIPLPGDAPRGRGISADGGRSIVVTYEDRQEGFVGLLSLSDNQWKTVELSRVQDLALVGVDNVGVAAGGGRVTLFDTTNGATIGDPVVVGGRALDGAIGLGGRRAIFIVSAPPHVVLVDLERARDGGNAVFPPGEIPGAAGVAMSEDGKVAYVTSLAQREVVSVDMESGAVVTLAGNFNGFVGAAVYSDRMRSIFALRSDPGENIAKVLGYSVAGKSGFESDTAIPTLPVPSGIAAGPGGRRLVVVSSGTSTLSAGLTVIDADIDVGAEGSTVSYPLDPDDTYVGSGGFVGRQRYSPASVAVIYGR